MILDTIHKSMRFVLGEAKTTTDCDVVSVFADTTNSDFLPTSVNLVTNGTTAVTAVPAPSSGVQRQANEVRLFNNDTVPHLVTLQLDNNGTIAVVERATVPVGGSFLYTPQTSVTALSEWNAGTVSAISNNFTIASGNTLDLANGISIIGTAVAGEVIGTFMAEGVGNNLTLTGSTQAGALALVHGLNLFGTVAAASGGMLPLIGSLVAVGTWVDCFNTTVTLAQLYGTAAQTIDGAAAATGVPLSGGNRCRFFANTGSTWVSAQMGVASS